MSRKHIELLDAERFSHESRKSIKARPEQLALQFRTAASVIGLPIICNRKLLDGFSNRLRGIFVALNRSLVGPLCRRKAVGVQDFASLMRTARATSWTRMSGGGRTAWTWPWPKETEQCPTGLHWLLSVVRIHPRTCHELRDMDGRHRHRSAATATVSRTATASKGRISRCVCSAFCSRTCAQGTPKRSGIASIWCSCALPERHGLGSFRTMQASRAFPAHPFGPPL